MTKDAGTAEELRVRMLNAISTNYEDEFLSKETIYSIYEKCAKVAEQYTTQRLSELIGTEIKEMGGKYSVQLSVGDQKFYLQGSETKEEAIYIKEMFNKAIQCE